MSDTANKAPDTRNVIDLYRYWTTEAIKADLDTKRHNFSVLCWNLDMDFNVSTVVRNSNAFLADTVYLWPKKKYDKRGAVGTFNYMNMKHVKALDEISEIRPDALWVAIDNVPGSKPIEGFDWPSDKHIILCFGQESVGLPPEILNRCAHTLYITQYGSVRSLNVGCASSIAMYDLVKKLTK